MKEDIPTNSTLDVKLDYIQRDINVIKADIKEIKNDYVSRREFETEIRDISDKMDATMSVLSEKVSLLNKVLYSIVSLIGVAVVAALLRLIVK